MEELADACTRNNLAGINTKLTNVCQRPRMYDLNARQGARVVPSSTVQYSEMIGKGNFGEVYKGNTLLKYSILI